jgi:hypothetical protein
MISEASRLNSDEARAGVLFEARFIVFEPPGTSVKWRSNLGGCGQAGHLPHGRA